MERQRSHPAVESRKHMSVEQMQFIQDRRTESDVLFLGAKGAEGFKAFLIRKFGSVLAGWRELDKRKSGRVSFSDFCAFCRTTGYHGNLKKTWNELDSLKKGHVTLLEIDSEVGQYVGCFKVALNRKYGDMLTAWRKGVDVNGNGRISKTELMNICESLKLPKTLDSKRLFKILHGGGNANEGMTLMDFDPDAWKRWVAGDQSAVARVDLNNLDDGKSRSGSKTMERQGSQEAESERDAAAIADRAALPTGTAPQQE